MGGFDGLFGTNILLADELKHLKIFQLSNKIIYFSPFLVCWSYYLTVIINFIDEEKGAFITLCLHTWKKKRCEINWACKFRFSKISTFTVVKVQIKLSRPFSTRSILRSGLLGIVPYCLCSLFNIYWFSFYLLSHSSSRTSASPSLSPTTW